MFFIFIFILFCILIPTLYFSFNTFKKNINNPFVSDIKDIVKLIGNKFKSESYCKILMLCEHENEVFLMFKELEIGTGFELKTIDYGSQKVIFLLSNKGCVIAPISHNYEDFNDIKINQFINGLKIVVGKNCINNIIVSSSIKTINLQNNIQSQKEKINIILKIFKKNIPCYFVFFKLSEIAGLDIIFQNYIKNGPEKIVGFTLDSYEKSKVLNKISEFNALINDIAIKYMVSSNVRENEYLAFSYHMLNDMKYDLLSFLMSFIDEQNKINNLYIRGVFFIDNNYKLFANLIDKLIFEEKFLIFAHNNTHQSERNFIKEFCICLYLFLNTFIFTYSYKSFSLYTDNLSNVLQNIYKLKINNENNSLLLDYIGSFFSIKLPNKLNPMFIIHKCISFILPDNIRAIKSVLKDMINILYNHIIEKANNISNISEDNFVISKYSNRREDEFMELVNFLTEIIQLNECSSIFNELINSGSLDVFYDLLKISLNTRPTAIPVKSSLFKEIILDLRLDRIEINKDQFTDKFKTLTNNFFRKISSNNYLQKLVNKFIYDFDNFFMNQINFNSDCLNVLEQIYHDGILIKKNVEVGVIAIKDLEKIDKVQKLILKAKLENELDFFKKIFHITNINFYEELLQSKSGLIKNLFKNGINENIEINERFNFILNLLSKICESEAFNRLKSFNNIELKENAFSNYEITYWDEIILNEIINIIEEEKLLISITKNEISSDLLSVDYLFKNTILNISKNAINNLTCIAEKQYFQEMYKEKNIGIIQITKLIEQFNTVKNKIDFIVNNLQNRNDTIFLNKYVYFLSKTLKLIDDVFEKQRLFLSDASMDFWESGSPIHHFLSIKEQNVSQFFQMSLQQISNYSINVVLPILNSLNNFKNFIDINTSNLIEKWEIIICEIENYKNNKGNTSIDDLKNFINIGKENFLKNYVNIINKYENSNIYFHNLILKITKNISSQLNEIKKNKLNKKLNNLQELFSFLSEKFPFNAFGKSLRKEEAYKLIEVYKNLSSEYDNLMLDLNSNVENGIKVLEDILNNNVIFTINIKNNAYRCKLFINNKQIDNLKNISCSVYDNIKIEIVPNKNNNIIIKTLENTNGLISTHHNNNLVLSSKRNHWKIIDMLNKADKYEKNIFKFNVELETNILNLDNNKINYDYFEIEIQTKNIDCDKLINLKKIIDNIKNIID